MIAKCWTYDVLQSMEVYIEVVCNHTLCIQTWFSFYFFATNNDCTLCDDFFVNIMY